MALFHSGVGGKAKLGAAGADIAITDWTLTLSARLAETTHSGDAGVAKWQKVLEEGSGTFNAPWDSEQVPDTDISIGPGDTITDLRLFCGDSLKFFSFAAIVESLENSNNAQNDIHRYTINFKANGAITHPVT